MPRQHRVVYKCKVNTITRAAAWMRMWPTSLRGWLMRPLIRPRSIICNPFTCRVCIGFHWWTDNLLLTQSPRTRMTVYKLPNFCSNSIPGARSISSSRRGALRPMFRRSWWCYASNDGPSFGNYASTPLTDDECAEWSTGHGRRRGLYARLCFTRRKRGQTGLPDKWGNLAHRICRYRGMVSINILLLRKCRLLTTHSTCYFLPLNCIWEWRKRFPQLYTIKYIILE